MRLDSSSDVLSVSSAAVLNNCDQDVFVFPVSFAQERIWFLEQLESENIFHNVPAAVRLPGPLSVSLLERCIEEMVRRHESLRTTFGNVEGRPVQIIAPELHIPVTLVDLEASFPPSQREAEAQRLAAVESRRPFDLVRGPLLRVMLLRLAAADHVLLLTLHHIISDGWSMGVLLQELSVLYEAYSSGRPSPLAELAIQYPDFAQWQRQWLQGEVLDQHRQWWCDQLQGAPAQLELPADRPRPGVATFRGAVELFQFTPTLSEALKQLSQREGVTLFMTLLAAFQTLLARYTGQSDIVVGTPIANRTRSELEPLIGFFVNTLVLRTDLGGNPSFRELLARVRENTLGAYAHQDLPFEKLVEDLQPERSLSRNPLFQVMLVLQNGSGSGNGGATVRGNQGTWPLGTGTSKFDLTLFVMEGGPFLTGAIEYSTDLFEAERMRRLAGHFQVLLEAAVANPSQRVWELPLLSDTERRQMVVEWNRSEAAYPPACLHQLFEAQVERTPEAVAVVAEGRECSYRELNERANRLAHYLRKQGVGPESLVGICLERSPEMVQAVLAVLKAGAAYLPIDPDWKPARLLSVLADTAPAILLTNEAHSHGFDGTVSRIVLINTLHDLLAAESASDEPATSRPDGLVCVIPVCGPTNHPDCVAITHAQIACLGADELLKLDSRDRVAVVSALSRPESFYQIWLPLCAGARLVIQQKDPGLFPHEFASKLRQNQISIVFLDAASFSRAAGAVPWAFGSLRCLLVDSDTPSEAISTVMRKGAPVRFFIWYGPLECGGLVCLSPAFQKPGTEAVVFAGQRTLHTKLYVLDERQAPVPVGIAGEIYVGGNALCRGYYGRPERTAACLVPDPSSQIAGARLYRSGDRGCFRADGTVELLGRLDRQCKIHSGCRFETREIEDELLRHDRVVAAAVDVLNDSSGVNRLTAWLVASEEPPPTPSDLRYYLRRNLPDYMIPENFVFLRALPLTAEGTVDYTALPLPGQERPEMAAAFEPPRNAIEETLAKIWSQVFSLKRIGRNDNFFQLGGHSLLATQIIARMSDAFQTPLPLRQIFVSPTLAGLAGYVETHIGKPRGLQPPLLLRSAREGKLPLSFSQERLWFLDQWEPGSAFYNVSAALHIPGPLSVEVLQRCVNEIVRRHESLRTSFPNVEGSPIQKIAPILEVKMPVVDVTPFEDCVREAEAQRQAAMEGCRPFDLAQGPLLRVVLLRLAANDHVVVLTMHHIVSDGWSLGVLFRELSVLYEAYSSGRASPLPELDIQYADFAQWQREWLQGEVLETHFDWWRQQLQGAPEMLELPTDRPRPAEPTFRGASEMFEIPAPLCRDLKTFNQREGVTLFMTLLATFQTLLARYTGQFDIVVGSPIANRSRAELEPLIGFFVNTLALRTRLDGDPTFRDLLARVRETTLGAYAHQDLPFEKLVEELQPERALNRNPLFQIMLVLQNVPGAGGPLPGGSAPASAPQAGIGTSRFDLVLAVVDGGDRLSGGVEYSTDLFDAPRIRRLLEHFQTLLAAAIADPECRLSSLPLLTEPEARQIVTEWNDTSVTYPAGCLHEWFEMQAANTPAAVALVSEICRWTYAELNDKANRLAHYLQRLGVGPESLVGVSLERSPEMVVALLAVLKAGGAYVPFDPDYPPARLDFMRADSQCSVLLTKELLDREAQSIAAESCENLPLCSVPENLAYMIYTSGSTGQPKGAMNTHAGIVNRLRWMQDVYGLTAQDRVFQKTPFSFDVSVWEVFWPLITGARLVLARPGGQKDTAYLARLISKEQITTMHFVPSMLQAFLEEDDLLDCGSLRRVICSGEALSFELQQAFFKRVDAELHNLYGPTEAAVDVSFWECCRGSNLAKVPIGRPIANTQIYVLDGNLQPVPVGVPGELYIGGIGVGRGYWKRPDLTAERFLPNPLSPQSGSRLYRTGDLCSLLPDGAIEYLGRSDSQVKIRGFRIELAEIEKVAMQHDAVHDAAAIVRQHPAAGPHITCYVIPDSRKAAPLLRLLSSEREGLLDRDRLIELGSGMAVFGHNRSEIEFQYREIFERRAYCRHGVSIAEGACIFDVGANIGMFTLLASQLVKNVRVFAFEPVPEVFDMLERNVDLYGVNARCFRWGLGRELGVEEFTWYPHLSMLSGRFAGGEDEREAVRAFIRCHETGVAAVGVSEESISELLNDRLRSETLQCPVTTLSEVIRQQAIERIDLLKIDVEKSELDVLTGIEDCHWPLIQQVVMEVHDQAGRLEAIESMLRMHGFETVAEEDPCLEGTPLHLVWAVRRTILETQAAVPASERVSAWSSRKSFVEDVRRFMKENLPEYMMPGDCVPLACLPLQPNGKLDRRALSEIEQQELIPREYQPPRDAVEELLAELWAGLLHVQRVGTSDNFFQLGGHSLMATRITSWIRQILGVDLPLRRLFENPTVEGLAVAVKLLAGAQSVEQTARLLLSTANDDSGAAMKGAIT